MIEGRFLEVLILNDFDTAFKYRAVISTRNPLVACITIKSNHCRFISIDW